MVGRCRFPKPVPASFHPTEMHRHRSGHNQQHITSVHVYLKHITLHSQKISEQVPGKATLRPTFLYIMLRGGEMSSGYSFFFHSLHQDGFCSLWALAAAQKLAGGLSGHGESWGRVDGEL